MLKRFFYPVTKWFFLGSFLQMKKTVLFDDFRTIFIIWKHIWKHMLKHAFAGPKTQQAFGSLTNRIRKWLLEIEHPKNPIPSSHFTGNFNRRLLNIFLLVQKWTNSLQRFCSLHSARQTFEPVLASTLTRESPLPKLSMPS